VSVQCSCNKVKPNIILYTKIAFKYCYPRVNILCIIFIILILLIRHCSIIRSHLVLVSE